MLHLRATSMKHIQPLAIKKLQRISRFFLPKLHENIVCSVLIGLKTKAKATVPLTLKSILRIRIASAFEPTSRYPLVPVKIQSKTIIIISKCTQNKNRAIEAKFDRDIKCYFCIKSVGEAFCTAFGNSARTKFSKMDVSVDVRIFLWASQFLYNSSTELLNKHQWMKVFIEISRSTI